MKKYLCIILMFLAISVAFISCNNKVSSDNTEIKSFDSSKAQEISDKYLDLLCDMNIEETMNFLSKDLQDRSSSVEFGDTNLIAYHLNKTIESKDKATFVYDVIRSKTGEIRADRDVFTIKVAEEDSDYKIVELKASNKNQVYSKGDKLRFMGEEGGDSQLIVNINNLHIDVYPKVEGVMIEKSKVPHDNFGIVSLSYSGKKVALTTTDGNDNFIVIAEIDESLLAQGAEEITSQGNSQEIIKDDSNEKSIAKKIIPLDILKVDSINKLVFAGDEEKLIVEYIESGKERLKIYSADSGELVDVGLDEEFPQGEYLVKFAGLDKQVIKVKANNGRKEEIYKIDLEKKTIEKE